MSAAVAAVLGIAPAIEAVFAAALWAFVLSVIVAAGVVVYRKREDAAEVEKQRKKAEALRAREEKEERRSRPWPKFRIHHYTGGESALEPASNILVTDPTKTHRSGEGTGCEQDLVLHADLPHNAPCHFDRIQIMGADAGPQAERANALRTGLIWLFRRAEDLPEGFIDSMTAYADFTRERFDAMDKSKPGVPIAFFETKVPAAARDARPPSCTLLSKGQEAAVVAIKFLTTHGDGTSVSVGSIIFHQDEEEEECSVGGYRLGKHLGSGGFGDVFVGVSIKTKQVVAVKIEQEDVIKSVIWMEAWIIQRLNPLGDQLGFPQLFWRGSNCFVMDLMGPSVQDLMYACPGRKFTLKTTLLLADEMLQRLQHLHRRSYCHRDIKPDNFIFGMDQPDGTTKRHILHFCDFGLSARYRDRTTGQHIKYLEGRSVYGTPYFVSLNAHYGIEMTTRDDLEALGYCLVYFAKGTLPWLGMRGQGVRRTWHSRVA